MSFHVPEKYRVTHPDMPDGDDTCGLFAVKLKGGQSVFVIASADIGWEHVSVSRRDRCPTWDEMCQVKSMFWSDDDCVMQLHPAKSDWVNNHSFCLHLWRPVEKAIPLPPSFMVGFKELGVLV
jgi:hypothetical protein